MLYRIFANLGFLTYQGSFVSSKKVVNYLSETLKNADRYSVLADNQIFSMFLTEEVIKTLDEEGYTKREEGLELDHEKLYYGYNDSDLSLSLPINDQSLIYKKDDKWNIILKISQVGSNFGDRVKIEISSETNQ